jgi:MFS family permease
MPDRLFTPRFFTMCGFSFTVFVSVFQLLPAAPYHVIALGGSTAVAGLFLGFLTFSSALSAPFTGTIGDRVGQRRVLIAVSLVLAAMSVTYALLPGYVLMLVLVVVHGLFWSALLSASGAYMTATIPAGRRAEGLGYWGLAAVMAIGVAPPLGFWVFEFGWTALCLELAALNLLMALIAWRLPDDRAGHAGEVAHSSSDHPAPHVIEWRVLLLSISLGMIAFSHGSLTTFSALLADALGITPRSLFLTVMASAILVSRLSMGRLLDRIGHRRMLLPCLVVPPLGMVLLSLAGGRASFAVAAVVFGAGFGLLFPSHAAYVMHRVSPSRRGAAFGAMLAAFDMGIGLGSAMMGWLIEGIGYRWAFGAAALLAGLALPSFLLAERKLGFRDSP